MVRESGLVIQVPEVEPVVGALRERLDPLARLGVPAHVTVLYPFVPPEELDETTLDLLRRTFAVLPAFDFVLDQTRWFGEEVLWLSADDDRPFRQLTSCAFAAFPDHAPYDGQFGTDPNPHLTIGVGAEPAELREAERRLQPHLPMTGVATSVSLLVQDDLGLWSRQDRFPLAAPGRQPSTSV